MHLELESRARARRALLLLLPARIPARTQIAARTRERAVRPPAPHPARPAAPAVLVLQHRSMEPPAARRPGLARCRRNNLCPPARTHASSQMVARRKRPWHFARAAFLAPECIYSESTTGQLRTQREKN